MHVLASLAASAVAVAAMELYPGHQYIKRDLAARQTGADTSSLLSAELACATALQSAYVGLPSAPPVLASYAATVSVTDPCHYTFPASIESAASSYASAVEDWYSSHSAAIDSALSECPTYSGVGETTFDGVKTTFGGDVCSTAAGFTAVTTDDATATDKTAATTVTGKTTKATTTGTSSGTSSGTATTSASAVGTNAGARETGAVAAAAMAVVGVLGVVAAM